jgi:hypothetical protein
MHDPKKSAERVESPTPTPKPNTSGFGASVMDRATLPADVVFADALPLDRLYARFDAIARGRAPGNSSAAHQSVLERLASNQRRAEALGWSEFVLERTGGSGRLVLRGTPPRSVPTARSFPMRFRTMAQSRPMRRAARGSRPMTLKAASSPM